MHVLSPTFALASLALAAAIDLGVPGTVYGPQSGRVIAQNFMTTETYDLSIHIFVRGTRTHWASIFHFTNGGNYGHKDNRDPAMWLFPRSTRLHYRQGDSRWMNNGCDTVALPTDEWLVVEASVTQDTPSASSGSVTVVKASDGSYVAGCSWSGAVQPHGLRKVYLNGDPQTSAFHHYFPLNGDVKNLQYHPDGMKCVAGKLDPTGQICCGGDCESCGGCGCASFTGGASECCPSSIVESEMFCGYREQTGCKLVANPDLHGLGLGSGGSGVPSGGAGCQE